MKPLPIDQETPDAIVRRQANSIAHGTPDGHGNAAVKGHHNDRIRLLETQNRVLELIAKGASIERALECLAQELTELLDCAACSIHLFDPAPERMKCIAATQFPEPVTSILTTFEMDKNSPLRRAITWREPVVIPDVCHDQNWPKFRSHLLDSGFEAVWIEPILGQDGDPVGVIVLFHHRARLPSRDDDGLIDSLCPLARIAIEHERREQSLRQADERLTSLAANLPGVVYQRVVTPEEDIYYTYISEGARSLFGVAPEEILSDPNALFDCHHPDYRENFHERLLTASRELTMWDVEAPIISRKGEQKWSHAIARPHRRHDGAVVWDGIILDATRLKNSNLELAAANQAKSNFLANMSHELRTPLNAIIGFSEVMHKEQMGPIGNDRYREYSADILNSGNHLLKIINDILDIAKIEAGNTKLDEENIDIESALNRCVHMLRDLAADGNITVSVDCSEALPLLRADPVKLDQILINLLSNAVKFTPPGGTIMVSAENEPGAGLKLNFRDTGIGMNEEDVKNVVKPFHQADTGLDRRYEGTGLGLALVKGYVELHGGTLSIRSKPHKGTTVTVAFTADRCKTVNR